MKLNKIESKDAPKFWNWIWTNDKLVYFEFAIAYSYEFGTSYEFDCNGTLPIRNFYEIK